MAFGLLGLVVDGIEIVDPAVVSKSWPSYWDALGRSRPDSCDRHRPRQPPITRVAAFDVDGTLTRRDCVVPFLRRVAGTRLLTQGMLRQGVAVSGAAARRDRMR